MPRCGRASPPSHTGACSPKPPSTFPSWPQLVGTGAWGPRTDHTDETRDQVKGIK